MGCHFSLYFEGYLTYLLGRMVAYYNLIKVHTLF